jgi:magnesium-transporting ATPase (P-type)
MKNNKSLTSETIVSENIDWHSSTSDEVLENLSSGLTGLDSDTANQRLTQYGPNRLTPPKSRSAIELFLNQFNNVLIYVLIGAIIVTGLLQHWLDSAVITGVVIINAFIGFIQEGKAERALEAIRSLLSLQASVLRSGKTITIPAEQLVPGDIVVLQSGDRVPADMRLMRQRNLRIDESILTGESVAIEKNILPAEKHTVLADRKCMAYSGTLVTYGTATGVVVTTGDSTEIGRISTLLSSVEHLSTPLVRQMAVFARWLTLVIMLIAVVTFLFGVLVRSYSMTEMFLAAVGLAVAAIPEGLPAIMTITLAIGVQRMVKRNAIIRRLPAVETLGSVTTICSDKTGTLTKNEMTVKHLVTTKTTYEISGVGYTPHGGFTVNEKLIDPLEDETLNTLGLAALLCNDANLNSENGDWKIHGDPTEAALVVLAKKIGLDPDWERKQHPRMDVIPFEAEHRFMATLHHDHLSHAFIYIKGAPENVLKMCQYEKYNGDNRNIDIDFWHEKVIEIAESGERPLAIAYRPMRKGLSELNFNDVKHELILLGIFGITDPPREEAITGIVRCQEAGIRVMMITGDHASTAQAISKQLGISNDSVVTGAELDEMDQQQFTNAVMTTDVFARSNPEHKLRLVEALQANNHVIAMTGDGVNDAPALKRADVGIAMGQKGTEAAKEASEMVLIDDNFASIINAIEEGRTVYDNLRKSILYILPTSVGEAAMIIAAVLMGYLLPITPVQILWVNMVTTVTLALSLSFEPAERGVMKRPPRLPSTPLLSKFLVWRIIYVFSIMLIGTFGLYLWTINSGYSIELARTVTVNTLVMFEVFYLWNIRYLYASIFSFEGFFGNRYVIIAIALVILLQIGFTYLPFMQTMFKTVPLDTSIWIKIILTSSSVLFLTEIEKFVFRRLGHINN